MRKLNHKSRRGFTLIETLAVAAILLVVVGLLSPAVAQSRSSARRMQCRNNLKQIGLAMHNYAETYNVFPPGWISRHSMPDQSYGVGWGTSILPYIEESTTYNRVKFQQAMPAANDLLQTPIAAYRCPVDPTPDVNSLRSNYGTSNYSGNAGTGIGRRGEGGSLTHWLSPRRTQYWPGETPISRTANGIFWLSSSTRIRDIVDGTSHTIMVSERSAKSGAGIWAGVGRNDFYYDVVTDSGPGNEINKRFTSFSSYHNYGINVVFCDGRARFISENISSMLFQKLATRNGGEVVSEF